MAIEKERPTTSSASGGVPLSREQRWARYGSNVAIAIVLAAVVTIAVVWLAVALLGDEVQVDLTASGRYSLSERTQRVLETLDTDVSLDFVYPDPDESVYPTPELLHVDELEYARLKELLERYAATSGHITFNAVDPFDPEAAEAYLAELKKSFSEGFERQAELLGEFKTFRDDLDTFVEEEVDAMRGFAELEPTPPDEVFRSLTVAASELSRLSQKAQLKELERLLGAELSVADQEATLDQARSLVSMVADSFDQFVAFYEQVLKQAEEGEFAGPVPEPVQAFLRTAAERYEPLRDRAKALRDQLQEQGEEKFDEIEQRFQDQSKFLLVRGADDVQVLGPEDVWRQRPDPVQGTEGVFGGERAVTAAVLGVSSPTKPAVLFVTHGSPASAYGGPYARLAERLRDENFLVEDWDIAGGAEMPQPEGAAETVLVFVPPAPQGPQRRMPPPRAETYEPALQAIRDGAPAILLTEFASFMTPQVPYSGAFDELGLDVKSEAIAVQSMVVDPMGTEAADPRIEIKDYTPAPVTRSLGALPSIFVTAVPVMPREELPEGTRAEPLVLLPAGPDYWAETNLLSLQGGDAEREPEEDIIPVEAGMVFTVRTILLQVMTRVVGAVLLVVAVAGFALWSGRTGKSWRTTTVVCGLAAVVLIVVPFFLPGETREGRPVPLAVAVTRSEGDSTHRAVVFGDSDFATDRVAFNSYRYATGRGGTREVVRYPGNAELFVNAALWTLGRDELLAVSTDALDARRTGEVPYPLLVRVGGIVLGPVVLVALIGIVVLVVRRR